MSLSPNLCQSQVMRQPRDSRTDLVSWSLPPSGEPLSRLSVSTNLEKVAAAVPGWAFLKYAPYAPFARPDR